jgi:hypothetical protein
VIPATKDYLNIDHASRNTFATKGGIEQIFRVTLAKDKYLFFNVLNFHLPSGIGKCKKRISDMEKGLNDMLHEDHIKAGLPGELSEKNFIDAKKGTKFIEGA